MNVKISKFKGL